MDQLQSLLSEYDVVSAFLMTIKLTFFGAIGALVIGTLVAVMRVSPTGGQVISPSPRSFTGSGT